MFVNDEDAYLGRDDSGDTPVLERGSFEDARDRLNAMVDQIAVEFTAVFPDCPPMQRDGQPVDSVTGGPSDIDGIWPYRLSSESRTSRCVISSTRERADTALEIVTRVAADYGFQPHITFNDRIAADGTGRIAIEGWNADGDKYSFGSAVNTVLTYHTAERYTQEQLDAFEDGRTPPQPDPDTLETPSPTLPQNEPTTPAPSTAPAPVPTASPAAVPVPPSPSPSAPLLAEPASSRLLVGEVPDDTTRDRRTVTGR